VRFHNANYVIARWANVPGRWGGVSAAEGLDGEAKASELKLQISFKARLWETADRRAALWFGYTQQSHWQVLDTGQSRPFRETNYMPELMLALRPDLEVEGVRWRLANIGFAHQSNGRSDPVSRSWNRVYAEFGIEKDGFALLVRPWLRIRERPEKDDNPDITDYLGVGDATAIYRAGGHTFTLKGRGNPRTGKGAGSFEWSTPPLLGPVKGYLQVFSGYGESLIDYNIRQTTVGIGLSLNDSL
jgi:phospholipase A1